MKNYSTVSRGTRSQHRPRPSPSAPWPTADAYRLELLASIQDGGDVDLRDFFRKVYPQAVAPSSESEGPAVKTAEQGEAGHD